MVQNTDSVTLQGFVQHHAIPGATVYTDAALAYRDMTGFEHQAVNHSVGEYVRDVAHTNGIESFWSMLKRGYVGVFHQLSAKHLNRYGAEFAGCHNIRLLDTLDMIRSMVVGIVGKRLPYKALVASIPGLALL